MAREQVAALLSAGAAFTGGRERSQFMGGRVESLMVLIKPAKNTTGAADFRGDRGAHARGRLLEFDRLLSPTSERFRLEDFSSSSSASGYFWRRRKKRRSARPQRS
ncbi:unnamed protein product [Tetraodon nigroviridis]|uniref:(spotted green pufferfish) hypothetical protein n=1 Tax=Tetraodon nigroviridis TaxID=99883 RepID=Q4RN68_TETNG|nr:unnamed protein product [Tetraodon nigroviridis]